MTLKENVIREAGKYRINFYIKQVWKDSLPTASNTANTLIQHFMLSSSA